MSSQTSSDTAKDMRKLVESDADEVFVFKKKQEATVTKTVSFSISDLLEKINAENNKKKPIDTPQFKMGNLDFYFRVFPEYNAGYIGLFIENPNKDEVMITLELKETPQMALAYAVKSIAIPATARCGWNTFMSHHAYWKWAAENGDEFKITATVTLHLKGGSSEQWTTLRSDFIFFSAVLRYFITFNLEANRWLPRILSVQLRSCVSRTGPSLTGPSSVRRVRGFPAIV